MNIESGFNPEEEYAKNELIEIALKSLDEREERVIRLRFFEKMTLEAIAQEMGLSGKERVRQIESKALRKLKYGKDIPKEIHSYFEQLRP